MISWSNIFCCLRRFSSVVGLFISFLTSGLSFVKIVGGNFHGDWEVVFFFIFVCQMIRGMVRFLYFRLIKMFILLL